MLIKIEFISHSRPKEKDKYKLITFLKIQSLKGKNNALNLHFFHVTVFTI